MLIVKVLASPRTSRENGDSLVFAQRNTEGGGAYKMSGAVTSKAF